MKPNFAKGLIAARKSQGLTQSALANAIGTTQAAIARLESGHLTPTVSTMQRLANVLDIRFEVKPGAELSVSSSEIKPPTLDELQNRREEILALAESGGVRNLRVFGSVARQEATADSDIDLLAELAPGRTLLDLSGVKIKLEKLLGYRIHLQLIPRIPKSAEEKKSIRRILQEAVPL